MMYIPYTLFILSALMKLLLVFYFVLFCFVGWPTPICQAENELAEIGVNGCTFWQYNPSETYHTSGMNFEDKELLSPGRVRFENKGEGGAGRQNTKTRHQTCSGSGRKDISILGLRCSL